jgi:hypothetical protein
MLLSHINFIRLQNHDDVNNWDEAECKLFIHSLKKYTDILARVTGIDNEDNIGWFIPMGRHFIDVDKVNSRDKVNKDGLFNITAEGWDDGTGRVLQYSTRRFPITKSEKGHHNELSKYIPMAKKVKIDKFLNELIKTKVAITAIMDTEDEPKSK